MELIGNTIIHNVSVRDLATGDHDFLSLRIPDLKKLVDSGDYEVKLESKRGLNKNSVNFREKIKSVNEIDVSDVEVYKICDSIADRLYSKLGDFSIYTTKNTNILYKGMPIQANRIINSDIFVRDCYEVSKALAYNIEVDKTSYLVTNILINNIIIKL